VNPTCDDFDRLTDPQRTVGSEERELWLVHLEGCTGCREQAASDRALRTGLSPTPALDFSRNFDATLQRQLAERRRRPAPKPVSGALLAGYGTLAAGLSIWILGNIAWPDHAVPGAVGVFVLFTALASPLLLLPRSSPLAPPGP